MKKPVTSHRARKRFGQNFLIDDMIINQIVNAVSPRKSDHLVEIGPGQGAITGQLLASQCQLDVVELDRDLVPGLLAAYCERPNFSLHNADALKFNFAELVTDNRALRIVGNLPYNISTPLIFKLLKSQSHILDMHFMLQREVVQRLAASPNSKNWGRLAIMTQYYCQVESLFDVPPESFQPAPKVQSAVVRLTPHSESPWATCNKTQLDRIVLAAFSQRRKTLRNNLKNIIDIGLLEQCGVDPGARAETLSITQFIEISNASET